MQPFRPWGNINWILDKLPCITPEWNFFGCLGTEERSLAAWSEPVMAGVLKPNGSRLLKITELKRESGRFSKLQQESIEIFKIREQYFSDHGGNKLSITEMDLFVPHSDIVFSIDDFIDSSDGNIILDVTSLPKRFFFPILKRLLNRSSDEVKNILVTYSLPESYTRDHLALNQNGWASLPLFAGDDPNVSPDYLVAGIGFEPLGLREQVETKISLPAKLLIPFPAPPSNVRRSLDLVRLLKKHRDDDSVDIFRIEAKNVSDTFDRLLSISDNGKKQLLLAPFGPKPLSVGMCIYATLTGAPVFYTQPSEYNPNYSTGIAKINHSSEIYAYCLRLDGNDLYEIAPSP